MKSSRKKKRVSRNPNLHRKYFYILRWAHVFLSENNVNTRETSDGWAYFEKGKRVRELNFQFSRNVWRRVGSGAFLKKNFTSVNLKCALWSTLAASHPIRECFHPLNTVRKLLTPALITTWFIRRSPRRNLRRKIPSFDPVRIIWSYRGVSNSGDDSRVYTIYGEKVAYYKRRKNLPPRGI